MTPSPTPTPTTDACFYRDAEFNGETVHVLVDAFGRMLVQDDVTDILGVAWNDNGVTPDFETNGDYAAQFNEIRTAFGESDVITDITDNTVTFTDAEGGSVLLSFDNVEKTFVPTVSELTNGTPNMFYRTLNDGNADVTFVCDADGKVCYFGAGYLLLVTNGDEITQSSDGALLQRLYTACGGSTEITNHVSADGDYNKYTLDDFSFVTDAHGGITFGELEEYKVLVFTVWGDQGCTEKPSGTIEEAYVKVESAVSLPYGQVGDQLFTREDGNDTEITWYWDFLATVPSINIGDIIKVEGPPGGISVNGAETEFYT